MPAEKSTAAPAIVGLTGGIGSGKSTVASIFSGLGVPVLDLDLVGHRVTAPGSEGLDSLVQQFGNTILDDEQLNRQRLAEICFSSAEKTKQLTDIVHPLIWQQADMWMSEQSATYAVIEASVLIESSGYGRVDHLLVVMADMEIRKARVLQREGMSESIFESIIARQCGDADRLRLADELIENNGDLSSLRRGVEALHIRLLKRFGS